jgi:DedD protein
MEETLKARLIGAAVLVGIAVLLIPELLSGRKAAEPVAEEGAGPKGTRTFTIELGGSQGQPARSPTAVAAPATTASAPASLPTPVATTERPPAEPEVAPAVEPQPEPQVQSKAEAADSATAPVATQATVAPVAATTIPAAAQAAAPPTALPVPAKPATGQGWLIQVGAFGSAESARSLVKTLTAAGYPAHIAPLTRGGKTLHRVRVGPEDDRRSADQLAERLKARGLPATVVQND